jgi:hypothetical protein
MHPWRAPVRRKKKRRRRREREMGRSLWSERSTM